MPIREKTARANAEYVMVIHPEHIQVDENLRHEVVEMFNAENELDFAIR